MLIPPLLSAITILNEDVMRKIDRWVGVPLCFLATIFYRLSRPLKARKDVVGHPKRILFIELAEIGGLVVAYPALSYARRKFPGAKLYFLTFSGGEGILDLMGIVDDEQHIIIRPDGLLTFLLDTYRAIRRIRREKIDAVINLEPFARFSTLLTFFSGAQRRVGFHRFFGEGYYTGDLLTHKVIYNPHCHAAQTFISLVEALGEQGGDEPLCKQPLDHVSLELLRVHSSEATLSAARERLKELYPQLAPHHRLVLINPNASDLVPVRRWPTAHFQQLSRGLLEDPGVLLLITGTSKEWAHAERLRQDLSSDRVLNLAGLTTLRQLIDLYNMSDLLITNDSGPAHFASLTNLPVIALFGPETPRIYGPLGPNVQVIYRQLACSPCVSVYNQKRSSCDDNKCMTGITPEQVLTQALDVLSAHPKPVQLGG